MHLIELIFGAAPDGGSGMTEAAIMIATAAVLMTAFWARRSSSWAKRGTGKKSGH